MGPTPGRSHSAFLLPTLEPLLAEAGAAPADLTGVVACVGPGGFTALRIGVATAEGLALTGLPTWGFSAFAAAGPGPAPGGPRRAGLDRPGRPAPGGVPAAMGGGRPWGRPVKQALAGLGEVVGDARLVGAPEPSGTGRRRPCRARALELEPEAEATLAGLAALCRELPLGPPEAPLVPFYLRETDAEVNFPEASGHLSEALRRGDRTVSADPCTSSRAARVPEWVEAIDRACFIEAWGPLDECEHIWAYPPHAFARWRIIPEVQEAELLRIGVAVEGRRRGYGRALLRHSQAAMARLGVDMLHLEVRVSNVAARALTKAKAGSTRGCARPTTGTASPRRSTPARSEWW